MSKYKTIDVWNAFYGKAEEVVDYAGRIMLKSACGNRNSRFCPTIDHIRPLSKGGKDIIENIIICHCDTNLEKADSFPHWTANNKRYIAIRTRGKRDSYEILED